MKQIMFTPKQFLTSRILRLWSIYILIVIVIIAAFSIVQGSTIYSFLNDMQENDSNSLILIAEDYFRSKIDALKATQLKMYTLRSSGNETLYEQITAIMEHPGRYDAFEQKRLINNYFTYNEEPYYTDTAAFLIVDKLDPENPIIDFRSLNLGHSPSEFTKAIAPFFQAGHSGINLAPVYFLSPVEIEKSGQTDRFYVVYDYLRDPMAPWQYAGFIITIYPYSSFFTHLSEIMPGNADELFILDSEGSIIYSSTPSGTPTDISHIFPHIAGEKTFRMDLDAYSVMGSYDSKYGFYVVSIADKAKMTAGVRLQSLVSFFLTIGLTSVGVYLTVKTVRHQYSSELRHKHLLLNQKESDMKLLQAQINPHFLYNTLEIIRMSALSAQEGEAAFAIQSLAQLLRSRMKMDLFISIEEEINFCEKLLLIYGMKYDGEIDIAIEIDDESKHFGIPKDLIQPLVENVIAHAFVEGDYPEKVIRLKQSLNPQGNIEIMVADNGMGFSAEHWNQLLAEVKSDEYNDKHVGLLNVQQRIRLVYGEAYGLSIERADDMTRVIASFPPRNVAELNRSNGVNKII